MKKIKRALCLVLGLTMPFAAACGGKGKDKDNDGKIYSGRQLIISMRLSGYDRWLDEYIDEFANETGCEVDVTWDPNMNSEVRNIFLSDSYILSDLYFGTVSDLWYQWAKDGYLEPITGMDDRVDDVAGAYGIYNGNRYMLCPFMPANGFVYNKEYLQEIPSKGEYTQGQFPQTWQGLLDLCDSINEQATIGGRSGVKPMSWSAPKDSWEIIFRGLWAQGNGGKDWNDYLCQQGDTPDRNTFVNDSVRKAFKAVVQLINSDGNYSQNSITGCGEKDHIQQQQNFLNGDCVFAPTGAWFETEMKDSITSDTFEYGYANYPQIDSTEEVRTSFIDNPAEVFFIPANAEEKEMAQAFLEFVFTKENCKQMHKDLGTPMGFKYDFTESDVAALEGFAKEVTESYLTTKPVLKGANSIMYATGGCMGGLFNAKGDLLKIPNITLKKKVDSTTIDAFVESVLEENYSGYVANWDSKLKNAGLK